MSDAMIDNISRRHVLAGIGPGGHRRRHVGAGMFDTTGLCPRAAKLALTACRTVGSIIH